jgi:plasmid maintenance system antidote protein VapI
MALARASANLDLPNRVVGAVVGLSEPTISRLKNGILKRNEKEFELSLLFVRMYRSLIAIVGGDDAVAAAWLRTWLARCFGTSPEFWVNLQAGHDLKKYADNA